MKISVLSYSLRTLLGEGKMDVFGYLESMKYRYGLNAVDIWNGFLSSTDEDYLKKVKDGLEERELVLVDLCVDGAHLWEDDPDDRERNYQNALAHLQAAEILGAKFVRIDAGGGRQDTTWTNEQFDYIVMRYKEYVQLAHDNGFKMGAENHWGPEGRWANLKKLIDAVDHPAFGISLHVGGWKGEDAEEADRLVVPWTAHTHLAWRPYGGGMADEAELVEKMGILRDNGYKGYYSVEHHRNENQYAGVGVMVAKVRDILGQWRLEG